MDVAVAVGAIAPVPVEREAVNEVISWEEVVLAAVPDLAKGGTVGTVAGGVAARFESARSQEWRTSVGEKGDPGGGEQGKARGDGLVAGEEGNTLVDGGGEAGLDKGGRATWWLVRGRGPCWGKGRGRGRGGAPRRAVAR